MQPTIFILNHTQIDILPTYIGDYSNVYSTIVPLSSPILLYRKNRPFKSFYPLDPSVGLDMHVCIDWWSATVSLFDSQVAHALLDLRAIWMLQIYCSISFTPSNCQIQVKAWDV